MLTSLKGYLLPINVYFTDQNRDPIKLSLKGLEM